MGIKHLTVKQKQGPMSDGNQMVIIPAYASIMTKTYKMLICNEVDMEDKADKALGCEIMKALGC